VLKIDKIEAKVQRIEPTETSGVVFVNMSSKNGDLQIELPDKINYFSVDDKVTIRFVEGTDEEPEDDDKLFMTGYVFSTDEDEKGNKITLISIGGLTFRLELNKDFKISLKPKTDISIGFK
jgi:hypothetical protein